eukprot:scaffold9550_cov45-Cyclotella_meneghiniana.AAC.2
MPTLFSAQHVGYSRDSYEGGLYAIILTLSNPAVGLSFNSHSNKANFNGKNFVVSWYLNATNAVFGLKVASWFFGWDLYLDG